MSLERHSRPPTGRGVTRLISDDRTGRCTQCRRALPRRLDGRVIAHKAGQVRCPGSGQEPGEDITLASWLPVQRGLTPHGLRHGHETWLDDLGIRYVLQSERMGHEVPGMHGVYGHVSPAMRTDLKAALQERWRTALQERARIAPHSSVRLLDALLLPTSLSGHLGSAAATERRLRRLNLRAPTS